MNRYDILLGKKPKPKQSEEDKFAIKLYFGYISEKEKALVQILNSPIQASPKTLIRQYIRIRLMDSGDLPESFSDVANVHGITFLNDSSIDWDKLGFVLADYSTTTAFLNNYTRQILEKL